jgi:hypothetical protein
MSVLSKTIITAEEVKEKTAKAYSNPYIAGIGLGLVLLSSISDYGTRTRRIRCIYFCYICRIRSSRS